MALGLKFGEQASVDHREALDSLLSAFRQRLPKPSRAGLKVSEPSECPSVTCGSNQQEKREPVPSAEIDDGLRRTPGSIDIAPGYFEDCREMIDVGLGADMVRFGPTCYTFFDARVCIADIPEQPIRKGKVGRHCRAGILAEAELGIAITLGVVRPERLLKMCLRRNEVTLEQARQAQYA
jgi:hypothetical protein